MAEYLRKLESRAYLSVKARFDEMVRKDLVSGLTWQEVCDDAPEHAWFSNEQIFASLVKRKGYTQADYWEYVGKFRAQKVSVELPEVPKDAGSVISLIRNAGGVAVLAHPHRQTQFLPELYKMGLRGVECDHPDISPEDAAAARAFAEEKGLYISGGTDHTGLLGDYPFLRGDTPGMAERAEKAGEYHCPLDTDVRCGITKDEFDALKDRVYG
jgi:predicted metal-dependent phosphoesterase TrpH